MSSSQKFDSNGYPVFTPPSSPGAVSSPVPSAIVSRSPSSPVMLSRGSASTMSNGSSMTSPVIAPAGPPAGVSLPLPGDFTTTRDRLSSSRSRSPSPVRSSASPAASSSVSSLSADGVSGAAAGEAVRSRSPLPVLLAVWSVILACHVRLTLTAKADLLPLVALVRLLLLDR